MNKLDTLLVNAVFALQVLLVFLLIFEDGVSLPAGLQVAGRLHPLVLHLPIGFLALLGLLAFWPASPDDLTYQRLRSGLLLLTALAAALTALAGFLLAREGGYEAGLLARHKWWGLAVSWLAAGLTAWERSFPFQKKVYHAGLALSGLALLLAGHFGGELTHGEGYVLAPLQAGKKEAITEETPLYAAAVAPILEEKCTGCHNERKAKGGLVMTTPDKLARGGKNGAPWIAGDPAGSLLVQRLLLPADHEEHMPPAGKPQPSEEEIRLLGAWIAGGADHARALGDYPPGDSLLALARAFIARRGGTTAAAAYDFPAAAAEVIHGLNTPFRTVAPLAAGSPALHAEIFVRASYQPAFLEELLAVRGQLVSLNLANLPVSDAGLSTVGRFERLEKLVLNGADISTEGLVALRSCRRLRSLALSGTRVDEGLADVLPQLPALREVFIWNTAIDSAAAARLAARFPKIAFETGFRPDPAERLPLPKPVLDNPDRLFAAGETVALSHPLPGVVIRYTLDGAEPDSLAAPVYRDPIAVNGYTVLKARAFSPGWQTSETALYTLFSRGLRPDSVALVHAPDPRYRGGGAAVLTDGGKGDASGFGAPAWLGFRQEPLAAYVYFRGTPPTVRRVTLSYARNIGAYIMPPLSVEVWGGPDEHRLKRLAAAAPPQPAGYLPNGTEGIEVAFPAANYACYRVVARPLPRLPAWHAGKGDKGWLFVDEVVLD